MKDRKTEELIFKCKGHLIKGNMKLLKKINNNFEFRSRIANVFRDFEEEQIENEIKKYAKGELNDIELERIIEAIKNGNL
jgi:5-methylcytosine-specific restriction endonuclease McrBC regulatory subunit McrC